MQMQAEEVMANSEDKHSIVEFISVWFNLDSAQFLVVIT